MLNTMTSIIINGTSTTEEGVELLGMESRLEYDGSTNTTERCPDRKLYLANKETADKDRAAFRTYVENIVNSMDKEVTSNETV